VSSGELGTVRCTHQRAPARFLDCRRVDIVKAR
jgi:hypothetical protein